VEALDIPDAPDILFRLVLRPDFGAVDEPDIAMFDHFGPLARFFLSHDRETPWQDYPVFLNNPLPTESSRQGDWPVSTPDVTSQETFRYRSYWRLGAPWPSPNDRLKDAAPGASCLLRLWPPDW
jgi:hypothetical protein